MTLDFKGNNGEKAGGILLALLPFWDPQIPPSGISCLKSYLRGRGHKVSCVDANITGNLNSIYHDYFDLLKGAIPADKQGNYYKIGHDVLRNHLMAFLHHTDNGDYLELVKILVEKTYFTKISNDLALRLCNIVELFFKRLHRFLMDVLQRTRPRVLGLSVYGGTLPASVYASRVAKEFDSDMVVVMGGGVFADQLSPGSPDFEYFSRKVDTIDHMFVGEGELLFSKYLEGDLPDSQRVYSIKDIGGETFDLGGADIMEFSDFDLQHYPYLASYSSRSCPFQCGFCSETIQWGRYRRKEPEQVAAELLRLKDMYGYRSFLMCDSLLNPVVAGVSTELEKADASVYWDGYLRADSPVGDVENTIQWRRGGFYRARLGVESGSERILREMGKKITPDHIRKAVGSLAYAGIKATTYWVIGYPGETEAEFQQTLDLIEELKDDLYTADGTPFNFSYSGQVNSQGWNEQARILYPEWGREMLLAQTWYRDAEPSREEIFHRMWRFVDHLKAMGVPTPYTLNDVHMADKRWVRLHPNAVPPLVELKSNGNFSDERKHVKKMVKAGKTFEDDGDFGF